MATYTYRLHGCTITSEDQKTFVVTRGSTVQTVSGTLADAIHAARHLKTGVSAPLATDPEPPASCCES